MLTYKIPKPLRRPFARGELVEVCDRDLNVMSLEKIVFVGNRTVRLEHGRRFLAKNGWYVGHCEWPFPSIRHRAAGREGGGP